MRKFISWISSKKEGVRGDSDWKVKTIKAIFRRIIRWLPNVELPEIKTTEGKLLQIIKTEYKNLTKIGKDKLIADWKLKGLEIDDLENAIEKGFNMATLLAEDDNFYRDKVGDLFLIICLIHEKNKELLGKDYLEIYARKRAEFNTKLKEEYLKREEEKLKNG